MNLAPLPTPLEQRALCWVYLVVVAEALFSWTSRSEVCNCCFVEPLADHPLHRHCVGTLRGGHSVDPALCPACQEKEQDDFTVTLLGLRFPDRELVPHFDFSLRPYMLCPVGWALLCVGAAGINCKNCRAWIPFPSLSVLLYISFYASTAHCKQWFPFLFILLLTHVYSFNWSSFGSEFPFTLLLFYCILPWEFCSGKLCRLKHITYSIRKVACSSLTFPVIKIFIFYKALI